MKRLGRFFRTLGEHADSECLVWQEKSVRYSDLLQAKERWRADVDRRMGSAPRVLGIQAEFSPDAIALLLACLERGDIAVLVPPSAPDVTSMLEDASVTGLWKTTDDGWEFVAQPGREAKPLQGELLERGHAGFVIFSSGSTGRAKAVLHDVERFLTKFEKPGKSMRTLAFLLFDHIAGLDTLFYTLAYGGCLLLPSSRDPHRIASLLEAHRGEVLPASPTFLKMFLLSKAPEGRDLSPLKIITYGSEPMSQGTLDLLAKTFPKVQLIQKYGTSELGSPRSKSKDDGSLWLHFAKDAVNARIEDGLLWLKSPSAMMGYLNAPNPFDEEGWYCTGDLVERDGDWIRILGRESELINVGGEKVYPEEVEAVIGELDFVRDVLVRGVPNALTGNVVEAVMNVTEAIDAREVRKLVRAHCRERLAPFKVPAKVSITADALTSERQKKRRSVDVPRTSGS